MVKILKNPIPYDLKWWDGLGFKFKSFSQMHTQFLGYVVHHGDKFIELELICQN